MVIVVKNVGRTVQTSGAAHHWNSLPGAAGRRTGSRRGCQVEADVVGDSQVELAIAIVIDKSAARSPQLARAGDSRVLRHLHEGAIALIVIKPVLAVGGDEEVFVTVIVIIANAYALAPGRVREAGMRGDVRESAIVIVMKEVAGGRRSFPILLISVSYTHLDVYKRQVSDQFRSLRCQFF